MSLCDARLFDVVEQPDNDLPLVAGPPTGIEHHSRAGLEHSMRCLSRSVVAAGMALAVLALTCPSADAQVKPFKVTGGGIAEFIPSAPGETAAHCAVGTATGLGKYRGTGRVRLDAFTGPTTAEFSSEVPFVFTAANGDQLAFHYGHPEFGAAGPGEVTLYPLETGEVIAIFVAEFNPVPEECTGRFANVVDGSFTMVATTAPFVFGSDDPVLYTWVGNGWIEYGK